MRASSTGLQPAHFRNSFDALVKIAKVEGVRSLYTGLSVRLWMSVPASTIYYSTHEALRRHFRYDRNDTNRALSALTPMISGMTARLFAATTVSPLELMCTQMMAQTIGRDLNIREGMRMNLKQGGLLSLWKGLIPTLWRDVPFSGVYWMCYEYYKASLTRRLDQSSRWNVWLTSFLSGGASGTVATLATHPFDVLKTRKQASMLCVEGTSELCVKRTSGMGMPQLAMNILKTEGIGA